MLARKTSSRYINNKFTFKHCKVLALLSLMRKITQLQKNGMACQTEYYVCAVFWEALSHIYVTLERKLTGHRECIFSTRSIERNVTLETLHFTDSTVG